MIISYDHYDYMKISFKCLIMNSLYFKLFFGKALDYFKKILFWLLFKKVWTTLVYNQISAQITENIYCVWIYIYRICRCISRPPKIRRKFTIL